MGAGADEYKPVSDILHRWLNIPEYIHKIFKSMHMHIYMKYQIDAYEKHCHKNKLMSFANTSHINCLFLRH